LRDGDAGPKSAAYVQLKSSELRTYQMRNILRNTVSGALLFVGSVSLANASGWEIWTQKQGSDKLTIVASFGGDGSVEEAHLDMNLNSAFEVIETQTLRKGSICFANAEKNVIRAIPPSGAGTALKSAQTDTCMFTVRITSSKTWNPAEVVGVTLKECASSVKGIVPCEATVKLVQ